MKTTQHKPLTSCDCTNCFAIPGDTMIDLVHPRTGLSIYARETLEQIQLRYPGAELMSVEAFCAQKSARQSTPIEWNETTENNYREMLDVLPPASSVTGAFLVGEPCDHCARTGQPRFQAFRKQGEQFQSASRPMTFAEFKQLFQTSKYYYIS